MSWLLFLWIVVFVFGEVVCVIVCSISGRTKYVARAMLAMPVWPLALVVLALFCLGLWLAGLWRDAEIPLFGRHW